MPRKLSDASRMLRFAETAPVEHVELVLDLAQSKLDERKARSESYAERARKRYAKPAETKAKRTRRSFPPTAAQEAEEPTAAPA